MRLACVIPFLLGELLQAATVGPTDRFIPLVQDGGGWSTKITVINLSRKPETIVAAFVAPRGLAEEWSLVLQVTNAKVAGNIVDAILAPGAVATIETGGAPQSTGSISKQPVQLLVRSFHQALTARTFFQQ